MKYLILTVSLLALAETSFAQDRDVESFEQLYQRNKATVIRERNFETGIFKSEYKTTSDDNTFQLAYGLNADIKESGNISAFEAIYGHRFDLAWLQILGMKMTAKFREVAEPNSSMNATEEFLDESGSLTQLGGGISFRSQWTTYVLSTGSERIFETVTAYLTYNTFTEGFTSTDYTGWGVRADFGIHNRLSPMVHVGGKLSYQIIDSTRAENFEGESSSARALLLQWMSLGIDIGFYF